MPRNTPLTETTYTGLSDTAEGFTGPSTLDQNVQLGSPLQLFQEDTANPSGNTSNYSTYDFIDAQNPAQSLNLSGVSDPPFASSRWSNPNHGNANPTGNNASNAFSMLGKWGSTFAQLMGNHPETMSSDPSQQPTSKAVITPHHTASGPSTIILVAVVVGLFLLLLNGD